MKREDVEKTTTPEGPTFKEPPINHLYLSVFSMILLMASAFQAGYAEGENG